MAVQNGRPLSYVRFAKVATVVSLLYLGLATLYIVLRLLLLRGL